METVLQFSDTKPDGKGPTSQRRPLTIHDNPLNRRDRCISHSGSTSNLRNLTTHNSATPLLRLPRELRDYIWEYVCGGQLIHVKGNRGSLCYICSMDSPKSTHISCSKPMSKHLSLGLQSTSRQLYHETMPIFYGTNIFSFDHAKVWFRFMITLEPHEEWSGRFTTPLVRSLSGLKTLHVSIWLKMRATEFRRAKKQLMKEWAGVPRYQAGEQKMLYTGLGKLQRLRLDDVTCVVCDDEFVHACDDMLRFSGKTIEQLEREYRWTVADKRMLAEQVRTVLLGPGDEEYQEEAGKKKKGGKKKKKSRDLPGVCRSGRADLF
ncbi:hypothetical protein AOQ84DRAFT_183112 [Glonium stellatum]|uniref:DUF7730 domain-containing protein n=1 Tax=Glonium stellatum TaxID=574774 RepID=A0A8E2F6U4_9PEZI|nr:hypothetical protein AOQ84DRAFT_183112 [Glonium stellatum]